MVGACFGARETREGSGVARAGGAQGGGKHTSLRLLAARDLRAVGDTLIFGLLLERLLRLRTCVAWHTCTRVEDGVEGGAQCALRV